MNRQSWALRHYLTLIGVAVFGIGAVMLLVTDAWWLVSLCAGSGLLLVSNAIISTPPGE